MHFFTDAWLITGGTNAGVVKEVGEALNHYRYTNRKHGLDVPCIGICSWQYTAGNEQLESQTIKSSMINDNDTYRTAESSKSKRRSRTNSIHLVRLNLDY
jgi:hypothetical protein